MTDDKDKEAVAESQDPELTTREDDEEHAHDPPAPVDQKVARIKALALAISAVGGLVTGLGGLAATCSGYFIPPQDQGPVNKTYEVLATEIEKLNIGVQQNHEDILALTNWLDGYVSFADRNYRFTRPSATASAGAGSVRTHRPSTPSPATTASAVAVTEPTPPDLPIPEAPPQADLPSPDKFTF